MHKEKHDLAVLYDSLEKLEHYNIWKIQKMLSTVPKLEGKQLDYLITERKALSFNLNNGHLRQNIQVTDINGKIQNGISFSNEELIYLIDRLKKVSNNWLKSRYAHLLWNEKKHNNYAKISINFYIKSIYNIKKDELKEAPILLSAILFISKKSKLKIKESKEVALFLFDKSSLWLKGSIINSIIDNNIFRKHELEDISNQFTIWIKDNFTDSYYTNKHNLESALNLLNKLNKEELIIYELFAKNEDIIIKQHPDDKDFIKFISVGNKAIYLKKAKKIEEYEITLNEYNGLKQELKLNKVSWKMEGEALEAFNKYLNSISSIILRLDTNEILGVFAADQGILVNPDENMKYSEKSLKNSLSYHTSVSNFDINSNFKQLGENEKIQQETLKNYNISNTIKFTSLFQKVLVDSILMGKLNYYQVFTFFEENTWFGQSFKRGITDVDDSNSSWLSMIAPGLHNFFSQFEMSVLMNTNKINNFVLSIDSLTLKFEGALRDFIKLTGGNTTKEREGKLEEILLDKLLENPKLNEHFSSSDIELFKFTFTKNGQNIRNNVAHSFYKFSDYSLEKVTLIFLCLLRLGKYKLH